MQSCLAASGSANTVAIDRCHILAHGQLHSRSPGRRTPELLTPTEYEIEARPLHIETAFWSKPLYTHTYGGT
jgi:hypothetical protein